MSRRRREQHRAARRSARSGHRKAELDPLDLAGGLPPDLADRLVDELEAVDVRLGQVAPAGVQGQRPVGPLEVAVGDELVQTLGGAETDVGDGDQRRAREVLIELGHVDLGRLDPRLRPEVLAHRSVATSNT